MKEYGEVLEQVSLKDYNSFKIGGKCKYLVKPYDIEHLIDLIDYLKSNNIKYYILGNGTNVILDDNYFDGVIIKLDNLKSIHYDGNIVTCQSGVMLPFFVKDTLNKGYTSLGFASMIPGTVGGAISGNAGCYSHEIMEYVKSVTVLNKDNELVTFDKNDISFGYRYTSLKGKYIILSATFILNKGNIAEELHNIQANNEKRINSQPLNYPNVGSVFRNPENTSAGKLIDELGLKGYKIGDAMISEKHANFIVNLGNASFKDVINLIDYIKEKVKEKYNIDLVCEPQIVEWSKLWEKRKRRLD